MTQDIASFQKDQERKRVVRKEEDELRKDNKLTSKLEMRKKVDDCEEHCTILRKERNQWRIKLRDQMEHKKDIHKFHRLTCSGETYHFLVTFTRTIAGGKLDRNCFSFTR